MAEHPMGHASQLGIKQFRLDACLSYLFFDLPTGEAVLIDPVSELMNDYRVFMAEHSLKLITVLDSHTHADHYSASHLLRAELGVAIGMSANTLSHRVTRKLTSGDKINVGALELEVLETTGHTPDSLSFYGAGVVFTGDTLLVGSSGRTDFSGADPLHQWASLHEVLGRLPADTVVLPGHDYSDILFSTIGVETRTNQHLLIPSREEFAAFKNAEAMPNVDSETRRHLDYNLAASPPQANIKTACATACGNPSRAISSIATINVTKYAYKLAHMERDVAYVDVREAEEFREGHIPGTVNVPLSQLAIRFSELSRFRRIYFSCLSGGRSILAAKTFNYLEHPDVVSVSGGFQGWLNAGRPIEKLS